MVCVAGVLIWASASWYGKPTAATQIQPEYVTRLFDQSRVAEVSLAIDAADWQAMLDNPMAEQEYVAAISVDGYEVDSVSVRTKGNSSLSSVAGSDSQRYSFKIKMNTYVSGRSLYGLDTLNLNNNFSDSSSMKELLSYQLFNEMGAASPACSYAYVTINGESMGLYTIVEGIDNAFLQRHFGSAAGQLFKPEGSGNDGSNLVYVDDDAATYTGLETRGMGGKTVDLKNIIKLMKALADKEYDNIARYLDVDSALHYIAGTAALASYDSYLGNMQHNFYIYELNGVFHIIPWDYNMAFGGFGGGGGRGVGNPSDSTDSDGLLIYIDEPVSGSTMDNRPLVSVVLANEAWKAQYHDTLQAIVDTFYTDAFADRVYAIADLIRPYIEKDPTAFYTVAQFESSLAESMQGGMGGFIRNQSVHTHDQNNQNEPPQDGWGNQTNLALIPFARQMARDIQSQLNGTTASTNNGNGLGTGMGNMAVMRGGRGQGLRQENQEDTQQEDGQTNLTLPEDIQPNGQFPGNGGRANGIPGAQLELPEGVDMRAVFELIQQDVHMSEETLQALQDMGLSEEAIQQIKAFAAQMPNGMQMPGENGGPQRNAGGYDNRRMGGGMFGREQPAQTDTGKFTTIDVLLTAGCGMAMLLGVVWMMRFRRRRQQV